MNAHIDYTTQHFHAIEQQIRPWHVSHMPLIDRLRQHPRHHFFAEQVAIAYMDQNSLFSHSQLPQTTQRYLNAPKLEARLLQAVLEACEAQQHLKKTDDQPNPTIKVLMMGADTGYIPYILSTFECLEVHVMDHDAAFLQHTQAQIEHYTQHIFNANGNSNSNANTKNNYPSLSSVHMHQHYLMQPLASQPQPQPQLNKQALIGQFDVIFSTASCMYLPLIYAQLLNSTGVCIPFLGERPLVYAQTYRKSTNAATTHSNVKHVDINVEIEVNVNASTSTLKNTKHTTATQIEAAANIEQLVLEKTLFETWVEPFPAACLPTLKKFIF